MGRLTLVPTPFLVTTTAFLCAIAFFLYLDVSGDQASRAELSTRLDKIERQFDLLKSSIGKEFGAFQQNVKKAPPHIPLLTQMLNICVSFVRIVCKALFHAMFELFCISLAWLHCFFNTVSVATKETCRPLFTILDLWRCGVQCKVLEDSSFTCGWVGTQC
jgi:hypothetical protein